MRLRPTKTAFGVSLALLMALCCLAANAQSGRRQTKPPAVAPVPSPTPEPTPEKTTKPRDENELNFLVATGDRGARVSTAPLTFHDAARDGCAEQLRKRTSLPVDISHRDLTRGEAIQKAKAGKTTYVVLITVLEDYTSASAPNGNYDYEVEYVIFAPQTAKVLTSGRVYENGVTKGPVSVGRNRNVTLPTYREAALGRSGQEAADRMVGKIHLPPPTKVNQSA